MTDLTLETLRFRIGEASTCLDLTTYTIRAWIQRHGMFPEFRDLGTGNRIEFGLHHLIQLGAAKALHEASLSVPAACDVVSQSGAWPFRVGSQWLRAQPNHEGRWQQVVVDPAGEHTITINLAATWDRIEPGVRRAVEDRLSAGAIDESEAATIRAELALASALARDDDTELLRLAGDTKMPTEVRQFALNRAADIRGDRDRQAREKFLEVVGKLRERYGYADGLRELTLEYHCAYLIANMSRTTGVPESVLEGVAAQPFGDEALAWLDGVNEAAREAGWNV